MLVHSPNELEAF